MELCIEKTGKKGLEMNQREGCTRMEYGDESFGSSMFSTELLDP